VYEYIGQMDGYVTANVTVHESAWGTFYKSPVWVWTFRAFHGAFACGLFYFHQSRWVAWVRASPNRFSLADSRQQLYCLQVLVCGIRIVYCLIGGVFSSSILSINMNVALNTLDQPFSLMSVWLVGDLWMKTIGLQHESKLRSWTIACGFTILVAVEVVCCYLVVYKNADVSTAVVGGIYCLAHLYFGALFLWRGIRFYRTVDHSVYAIEARGHSPSSAQASILMDTLTDARRRAQWGLLLIGFGNVCSFVA
jgi:hypothetical protein